MKIIKKLFKFFIFCVVCLLLFIGGIYLIAFFMPKINIDSNNNLTLYDKNENLFWQGNSSKEWVALDDISDYVIDATISVEDKGFYKHFGFDIKRIIKAMYINITSKNIKQGASTITQQYAKNLFLDFDKNWSRKLKEAWLAIRIETHYSKDEILEGYLNTINYGNGVYGIENAAKYYFNKKSKDLTLAEASILVGIPKSPSKYSPLVDEESAKKRQLIILNSMVKDGIITENEKNDAYKTILTYHGKKESLNLSTLMYYQDAVIRELKTLNIYNEETMSEGIKIYTSLDVEAQTILENAMIKSTYDNDKIEVAAIMLDPNDGSIISLIGGTDYSKTQYNRAVQAKRQVGSTMKPYLYYAALENGFTAATTFLSEPTTFTLNNNQLYSLKNASDIYANSDITMGLAMAYSDNIYAVKTHIFLGEETLVNIAKRLGIETELEPNVSLPLGTTELSMIEHVGAYASFANEGYKVTPHLISRIEDNNGNTIYKFSEEPTLILNKSIVYIINELLSNCYDYSLINYNSPTCMSMAPKLTNKYAIKTGSTNYDVWTVGFNKNIVLGVWNGYDNNSKISSSDLKITRNIWADTVEKYLNNKEVSWYEAPDNIIGVVVNPLTGKVATDEDTFTKLFYFIKGTEPKN